MTDFITFDDGQGTFGPLTDLRPPVRLRTGAVLTEQRQARQLGGRVACVWTSSDLVDVLTEQLDVPVNELPPGAAHLCVNGRWSGLDSLPVPEPGTVLVDEGTGAVVMAHLPADSARALCESGDVPQDAIRIEVSAIMYSAPWDILDHLEQALLDDIASCGVPPMAGDQMHVHGTHQVLLHPDATVLPGVVADTTEGPVVVHEGAVVRSNASLCGPCVIGPGSIVMDGAVIKARTSIGPQCRVGGEVGGSILHGCSNKAHEGHLGDSLVGRWVNLGAGTTNSNLLNTYTEVLVRLTPDSRTSRTGRIFMGSVIGDHVKTAIGTRLMTGTVLGTGCMVASSTPPAMCLPAFTWLTDSGAGGYRSDKFLQVARTVMARRGMELGPAEASALQRLCEAAARRRNG